MNSGSSRSFSIRDWVDALWGFDFFVSYAQSDGTDYPKRLREELQTRGYSAFVDSQTGFLPGDNLRIMTRRRVQSSTHFVVVGRPYALSASTWVPIEADLYVQTEHRRGSARAPIIIDIDGALAVARRSAPTSTLAARSDLDDWLRIEEVTVAGKTKPDPATIDKLIQSFQGIRRERLRMRFLAITAALLLVLALGSALLAIVARHAQLVAEENLATASLNLAGAYAVEQRKNIARAYAAAALRIKDSHKARQFLMEHSAATLVGTYAIGSGVSAIAVSPNGRVALGDERGSITAFSLVSVALRRSVALSASDVHDVAFSPDGQWIAVSQFNGDVTVLDFETLTARTIYRASVTESIVLNDLAFLPDGRLTIATDLERELILLDSDLRQIVSRTSIAVDGYGVSDTAAHPIKPRVAILYSGGSLSIIDFAATTADRKLVVDDFPAGESLRGGTAAMSIAFDPAPQTAFERDAGDRLVVGLDDASVWLVNEGGELLKRLSFPRAAEGSPWDHIERVEFASQGRRLLAQRGDGTIAVFERDSEWRLERIVDTAAKMPMPALAGCCINAHLLITVSQGADELKVWDLSGAHQHWVSHFKERHSDSDARISALAFDRSGRRVAVGTGDGELAVLDRLSRNVIARENPAGEDQMITWVDFAEGASGPAVVSTSWRRKLRTWSLVDCTDAAVEAPLRTEHSLYAADVEADGRIVAAPFVLGEQLQYVRLGTAIEPVQSISNNTTEIPERLIALGSGAAAVQVMHSSHFYAVSFPRRTIEKFSLPDQEAITSMAASADALLVSTNVKIYRYAINGDTLTARSDVPCSPDVDSHCGAWQLAVDPKGRWLAHSSQNAIYVRQLPDGAKLAKLSGHVGQIDALAAAADGSALASGGLDGRVIVWELATLLGAQQDVARDAETSTGYAVAGGRLQNIHAEPKLPVPLQRADLANGGRSQPASECGVGPR